MLIVLEPASDVAPVPEMSDELELNKLNDEPLEPLELLELDSPKEKNIDIYTTRTITIITIMLGFESIPFI
jgi:hypothetical protein